MPASKTGTLLKLLSNQGVPIAVGCESINILCGKVAKEVVQSFGWAEIKK
jgi:hypothetical protein